MHISNKKITNISLVRFSVNNIIYGEHSFVRRIYHSNRLRCVRARVCGWGGEGGGEIRFVRLVNAAGRRVKNNAFGNRRRAAYGRTGRFITSGVEHGKTELRAPVGRERRFLWQNPIVLSYARTPCAWRGSLYYDNKATADLSSSRRISFTGVYTAYTYIYLFTSIAPPVREGGRGESVNGGVALDSKVCMVFGRFDWCTNPNPGEFRGLAAKTRSNDKRDGSSRCFSTKTNGQKIRTDVGDSGFDWADRVTPGRAKRHADRNRSYLPSIRTWLCPTALHYRVWRERSRISFLNVIFLRPINVSG